MFTPTAEQIEISTSSPQANGNQQQQQTPTQVPASGDPKPVDAPTPQAVSPILNRQVIPPAGADQDANRPREENRLPTATPPQVQPGEADAFIVRIEAALNDHDWRTLTSVTADGLVNYFGHRYTSNTYISRDMENDARTYSWSHVTYYPASFTHEVSSEYSSHWNGPIIYDSINVYSEIQERGGRLHRALTRLTVGYTVENGVPTVYALVFKVL